MMDLEMALRDLLGYRVEEFTVLQMVARGFIVYVWVLCWLRIGERRAMGKHTAMDVILGVMIGSVASRAINSNAAVLPTLLTVTGLVGLHWVLSYLSFRSDKVADLVKGKAVLLIDKGECCREAQAYYHITDRDLHESMRIHGNVGEVQDVKAAFLETSGQISVVHCKR